MAPIRFSSAVVRSRGLCRRPNHSLCILESSGERRASKNSCGFPLKAPLIDPISELYSERRRRMFIPAQMNADGGEAVYVEGVATNTSLISETVLDALPISRSGGLPPGQLIVNRLGLIVTLVCLFFKSLLWSSGGARSVLSNRSTLL